MNNIDIRPRPLYAILHPLKFLFLAVLFLGAALVARPYFTTEYLTYSLIGLSLICLISYILSYLFLNSVKYTITPERIVFKRGIFTIKTDFIELYRVQDFAVIRSFLLRFIGAMNFRLDTLDKSHSVFTFRGIPKSNVDEKVRELVEIARREKNVFIAE